MTSRLDRRFSGLVVLACVTATCARPIISNTPRAPEAATAAPIAQLWIEPADLSRRNLLVGSGPRNQAPSTTVEYTVKQRDESGYSRGYDVVGPDGREWDIKVGKEAQTEIVLSRVLWALGYHQPATYYMTGWKLAGTWEGEGEPARFRLQSDHETDGEWAWLDNPFNDARPFRGLIAINLLLGNWDFKTSNNRIYRMRTPDGLPARRYVVQDLGASLGKPRVFPVPIGTRNDIEDFEGTSLIKEVHGNEVSLDYRGIHGEVLERLRIDDVIWACELMNRLRDGQLDDAFEAAEYEPAIRSRFITKIRSKIQEGLALRSTLRASAKD
jgi:hypothetical protein